MALEMKPVCEKCGRTLVADEEAYICRYDCTFCGECNRRHKRIRPNCGGELVARAAHDEGAL
jgi:hypothetical protein